MYEPSVDHLTLGPDPGTLTFLLRTADGVNVRKTFYFQPDRQAYVLNAEISIDQSGTPKPFAVNFGPAIGYGHSTDSRSRIQAIHFLDGSVARVAAASVPAQPRYEGAIRYAGVEDHYFLVAALPASEKTQVDYADVTAPVPGGPEGAVRSLISFSVRPNPGAAPTQAVAIRYFLGPKVLDQLSGADLQLTRAIDFGWFAKIVVPLLQALKWINGYLGNYGVSIIVLTILINILIFPLRHRSMVSMKKMQALQPQIKAIQDRYAKYKLSDPERQKMNPEMMALYKQKGVNPASGCIPMLLTFPILLAFYNLLNSAIELRGAMFIPGWINDLASKDPTYVWPILMGLTMFWQQKMTPSTADPDAAEDLPADAGHLHRHVPEHAGRARGLLADQQHPDDRSAVPDQSPDFDLRRREKGLTMSTLDDRVVEFVLNVTSAMGLTLEAGVEETPDHLRVNLTGDGADALLHRKGEALDALQVIVNTAFRRDERGERHYVVDALGFRKGKDEELRQMARFLADKAKSTGTPQEIGPLNPYARRIVHLTVAEDESVTSESIGDAFLKTVLISRKGG